MTTTLTSALPSLSKLPSTYFIQLDNFGAISLNGEEQSKYLQGQVTCDVNASTDDNVLTGAHCDAKGKVFSVFRLINRDSAHLLIQPQTTIEASLAELKKFGVFSKVTIEQVQGLSFTALVGEQAGELIKQEFTQAPDSLTPVIQVGSTTLIYITGQTNRFILIDQAEKLIALTKKLTLPVFTQQVWNLLEITEGFPILAEEHSRQYVPQMLNLQAISGISFTKGCYLGQETVARMQYLGKNKRALFSLTASLSDKLNASDTIEKQLGENWRKAGDILTRYQADDGQCYFQAVLSNDEEMPALRLGEHTTTAVNIACLPYSLITE